MQITSIFTAANSKLRNHMHTNAWLTEATLAPKIGKMVRNFCLHVIPSMKENAAEKILLVTFACQVFLNSLNDLRWYLDLQWLQKLLLYISQSANHNTG